MADKKNADKSADKPVLSDPITLRVPQEAEYPQFKLD